MGRRRNVYNNDPRNSSLANEHLAWQIANAKAETWPTSRYGIGVAGHVLVLASSGLVVRCDYIFPPGLAHKRLMYLALEEFAR